MDTVLIVDDSSMLLNYLEGALAKHADSFSVLFAQDGMEAIDIIKANDISLLVTDLQMPRIDGLGLLAYVHKYHPHIPCIVMSAHGTPAIIENLQSDILQFIEKPCKINPDKLEKVFLNQQPENLETDLLEK